MIERRHRNAAVPLYQEVTSITQSQAFMIALCGPSGSGKTEVAKYLETKFGYERATTGSAVRAISNIIFGVEAKAHTNSISEALMKAFGDVLWIEVALRNVTVGQVVLDSVRYVAEAEYLVARGFRLWLVSCPNEAQIARLRQRSQTFTEVDLKHKSETEFVTNWTKGFDFIIDTGQPMETWKATIDARLRS